MAKCNRPAYGLLYDVPISEDKSSGHFYCWEHFIARQKEIICGDNGLPEGNENRKKELGIVETVKRIFGKGKV